MCSAMNFINQTLKHELETVNEDCHVAQQQTDNAYASMLLAAHLTCSGQYEIYTTSVM